MAKVIVELTSGRVDQFINSEGFLISDGSLYVLGGEQANLQNSQAAYGPGFWMKASTYPEANQ